MSGKRPLGIDVLTAARQRIAWTFDTFPRIYVSFSGGKDSSVMLHLVMEEAVKRGRKVGVLFIDWEAQYQLTIQHIEEMLDLYADHIDPYWVALPLTTTNAVSQFEPEWVCWEPGRNWVRELPDGAITDEAFFPFYTHAMTFEEFVPRFGEWYGQGKLTACFVGIRANESLNRYRTIVADKARMEDKGYTTWINAGVYNVYPIYDWRTEDIWTYNARFQKPYNRLYDRMHQAGLSIHKMRICEPYGDEQRQGLWLFQVIEPETWGKVVARVNGANTGALYANEPGNVMGNRKVTKPDNRTWKEFAEMLLASMPAPTAEHYKNKLAVYLKWYRDRGYPNGIPDSLPGDTGSKDMPSWRRICKTLLKNDYWCKTLCFGPTKNSAYERYKAVMKKRRQRWGIF